MNLNNYDLLIKAKILYFYSKWKVCDELLEITLIINNTDCILIIKEKNWNMFLSN